MKEIIKEAEKRRKDLEDFMNFQDLDIEDGLEKWNNYFKFLDKEFTEI